jgi:hypothetical protein
MKLMGISDEAAVPLDWQIQATLDLGWQSIEMRHGQVTGFPKGDFHDLPDATWNPARKDAHYQWPGEGPGRGRDVLQNAFARSYAAGISIEPHLARSFTSRKGRGRMTPRGGTTSRNTAGGWRK